MGDFAKVLYEDWCDGCELPMQVRHRTWDELSREERDGWDILGQKIRRGVYA